MNVMLFMELKKRILKHKNLGLNRPFLICPAIFFPGEKNSKRVLTIAVVCDIIYLQKGREKKMSYCEQSNCGYYWKEEGEDFPSCHFEGWTAPCEYEDDYEEEE